MSSKDFTVRRIRAAALLSKSNRPEVIMRHFGVSRRTLSRWVKHPEWEKSGGVRSLFNEPPGRRKLKRDHYYPRAIALKAQGLTWSEVAAELDISLSCLHKIRKEHNDSANGLDTHQPN